MSRALSRRAGIASARPVPLDTYAELILSDTPAAYYRLNDYYSSTAPPYAPLGAYGYYLRDSSGNDRDQISTGHSVGGPIDRGGIRRIDQVYAKVTDEGGSMQIGQTTTSSWNVDATAGVPLTMETWVQWNSRFEKYRTLFRWAGFEIAIYNQRYIPVSYGVDLTTKTLKFCVKKPGTGTNPDTYTIALSGNTVLHEGNTDLVGSPNPSDEFATEVWHHIVVVVEYLTTTSRHITMYVDGEVDVEADASWTGTLVNRPMSIGGSSDWMDEVAIYQRELTSGEVTDHFDAGIKAFTPGEVTDLYRWYRSEDLGYGREVDPNGYVDNDDIQDWGVIMSPRLYGAPPTRNEAWYAKLPRYRRLINGDYPAVEFNPLTSTTRYAENSGWYSATNLDEFTAFFVFNPVVNNTEQVIFDTCGYVFPGSGTPPVENAFVFGIDPEGGATTNSRVAAVLRTAAGTRYIATDTVNVPTNTWSFYVVRYNGTTLSLYKGTSTTAVATATVSGFELEAGIYWRTGRAGDNGGGGRYFRGSMLELGFYQRALTTTEIGNIQTYFDRRYS